MQYLVFDANLTQRWRRVKEFVESTKEVDFWAEIKKHTRSLLKDLIEISMNDEIANYTQAQSYQRTESRIDYRNGYYVRNLDTELGPLDHLKIPRSRLGLFRTRVFKRYQRRQQAVNSAIQNVFLSGVSTRDVSLAIKPLLGTTFLSNHSASKMLAITDF